MNTYPLKKRLMTFFGIFGAYFLLISSSYADASPFLRLGIDFGGDKLAGLSLVNVSTGEQNNEYLTANEGIYLGGGITLPSKTNQFSTELSFGWKQGIVTASNQDMTMTRFPLEAVFLVHAGGDKKTSLFRIGGGLTYHLNTTFEADGSLLNGNIDFKNALGFVVQADMRFSNFSFGLKYTMIDYEADVPFSTEKVKANGAGIFMGLSF